MSRLSIDNSKCIDCQACIDACPFGAIAAVGGRMQIGSECRVCRFCLPACPVGAIALNDGITPGQLRKEDWRGILVYAEVTGNAIHPVTAELIGEAIRLGSQIAHPVYVLLPGHDLDRQATELLQYGVEKVFCYDHPELAHFRVDTYANACADCLQHAKPSVVLVGATPVGRSLAPRLAARYRTGLTADCTQLQIKENSDLVQIRPAFGGNIMAQIVTENSRPQFATVRYQVMSPAQRVAHPTGTIEWRTLSPDQLASAITVVDCRQTPVSASITDADILVVAGRGVKNRLDLRLLQEVAEMLGGQVAATRPLVEAGWLDQTRQIGLSGRTVQPRLIITCGVSGAVQFTAGMQNAGCIIAINRDQSAPIFQVAHYGLVGDLYEIMPLLLTRLKGGLPA